jgi:hypothetical protein
MRIDLFKHKYQSRDGRFWSTPEQADFVDGKISIEAAIKLSQERDKNKPVYRGHVMVRPSETEETGEIQ